MEKVTGIGGVFFKARDPKALAEWYGKHLGIESKDGHFDFLWDTPERGREAGRAVWSLFPADTDYLGTSGRPFMINYRVANLARMVEQLRSGGVAVEKVEEYDYGNFAWLTDPEGNRIELWEPKTPKA